MKSEVSYTSKTKTEGNAYAIVYAVTGVTRATENETEYQAQKPAEFLGKMATNTASMADGVYAWNQVQGQTASSSGNMYGIYDLSGGVWERTAGYVANGHDDLNTYGTSLAWDGTNFITASTKYAKVYAHNAAIDKTDLEWTEENLNAASKANYEMSENQLVYGNAMHETSTNGIGSTSWYNDYSYFPGFYVPFSLRGGRLWDHQKAGLFCFYREYGNSAYHNGFRPVVVAL